tara:strand:+ start:693 stop:953 length:261 start_codon:yes stop_codon:yes gene_type:complete
MNELSKYARVQVLAMRVQQLNAGAEAAVAVLPGDTTYAIAVRELQQGCMPIRCSEDNVPTRANETIAVDGARERALDGGASAQPLA